MAIVIYLSLYEIFNKVNPKPGEVFYDLGSGGGRVVLYAALSFPFATIRGIEMLAELDKVAQSQLKLMYKKASSASGFDCSKIGNIDFIQGDFTKFDVSDADIIYVASTCFEPKLMHGMADALATQVKPGTRVITATKSLPSDSFKINETKLYPMEWGQVTIYFQEKI
jgi:trans-aconitate methyltransferase